MVPIELCLSRMILYFSKECNEPIKNTVIPMETCIERASMSWINTAELTTIMKIAVIFYSFSYILENSSLRKGKLDSNPGIATNETELRVKVSG